MPVEMIPGPGGEPASGEAKLTRQVREGVHATDLRGRMAVAGRKIADDLPPGVDAPRKSWRKAIAGGAGLLVALRLGFGGFLLVSIGLMALIVCFTRPFDWRVFALALGLLGLGVLSLRGAWRAVRALEETSKA